MSDEPRPGGGETAPPMDFRSRAELAVQQEPTPDVAGLAPAEIAQLIHELRVHQIQLEMQNDELRRAQESLDESRARYFDLYDMAPVGYVTQTETGEILEANLQAAIMLGCSRAELVGQALDRFIVAEDQDQHYLSRRKLYQSEGAQVSELRMKHADGAIRRIRLETCLVRGSGQAAPVCRSTLSDNTEEHALRVRLAQNDRMASMGVLAAGVAHEINNPLTFVLYHAETLGEDLPVLSGAIERLCAALGERAGAAVLADTVGPAASLLTPEARADLIDRNAQVLIGVRRIRDIARGLNAFSRVEKGDPAPVNLNQALRQALRMAKNEIVSRATLHQDLGRLPAVLATEGKLAQIFLNLLVNASQAIDEGAAADHHITVRTWAEDGQVLAEITDTGHGIAAEYLERVFEPFFTTKGPERGTGLGLAISRRLANEFGGDVQIESTPERGTRVRVHFPATRELAPAPAQAEVSTSPARGRILIVDDEELVRITLMRILGGQHETVAVESGRAAQSLLAKDTDFDLLLCDLMMPDVTGIALHAWLSEHHPRLARHLAFITGGVFTPQTSDYLSQVPNIQIVKPFDKDTLLTQVTGLVHRAQSER